MYGLVWGKFLYLQCPKNGLVTYSTLLQDNGWEQVNLFENNLSLDQYVIWGHITNPEQRHTRGVVQYLLNNPALTIESPMVAKMLVSGVFDEHTYSLSMMLNKLLAYPIHWIPLDAGINQLNGDDLTNEFFKQQAIPLQVTLEDRKNMSNSTAKALQSKVNECKIKYNDNYQKLVRNFLEPDIILYNQTVEKFRNKYSNE